MLPLLPLLVLLLRATSRRANNFIALCIYTLNQALHISLRIFRSELFTLNRLRKNFDYTLLEYFYHNHRIFFDLENMILNYNTCRNNYVLYLLYILITQSSITSINNFFHAQDQSLLAILLTLNTNCSITSQFGEICS